MKKLLVLLFLLIPPRRSLPSGDSDELLPAMINYIIQVCPPEIKPFLLLAHTSLLLPS